ALRSRTAAIFDDVNVVTRAEHFDSWPSHAHFRPQASHDDILFARSFDGFAETRVVPRVHRTALDDWLTRKHIEQHRPDVTGKALGLDGSEHGRHVEFLRAFGEHRDVVDQ